MLMRWDPFRELDRLTEQLTSRNQYRGFPMDAYRRGEQFYVHFDLPGIDPNAIDLTVEHNVLTVKVERDWQPKEGDEVLVVERPRGSFSRQLFLGENLDASKVSANYESGVLTLTIPMAEKAKPHKVEVSVSSSQSTSIEAGTGHEAT
jgi:HSP20 family protein